MTTMFNPPHPGETLREDVLPALGLTVTQAAEKLGITRAALSRVLSGRAAITPEMAARLENWLGAENAGSAETWLAQQAAYDLWKVRASGIPVESQTLRTSGHPDRSNEEAAETLQRSERLERQGPKPPSPEELNHRARTFWDQVNAKFDSAVREWPGAIRAAAEQLTRDIQQRGPGNVMASMEGLAIDAAEIAKASDGYRASLRAKNPRPRKRATVRTETIASMKVFRREDRTLKQFMAAAEQGSIEGVVIKPAETHAVRFTVSCDAVEPDNTEEGDERKYAMSTLEAWWKEAGKNMG